MDGLRRLLGHLTRLSNRELNRALLARQGLLKPLELPLIEAVEAIGAIQAQYRPALPVALWSRLRSFDSSALERALERRELVVGTLLRATLHLVSAKQHPYYAAVAEASGVTGWQRVGKEPAPDVERLRRELFAFASEPRTSGELTAFASAWVEKNRPRLDARELEHQVRYGWRALLRSSRLVRVADRFVTSSEPEADPEQALDQVVRFHLGAFGPASAADVAAWTGARVATVRAALERFERGLVRDEDEAGRVLFDLPSAPRPAAEVEPPVRFLPWFDSVLLAYEPAHRARILPVEFRDRVYMAKNLQWLPTVLVDGFVAGTWSLRAARRSSTLKIEMFRAPGHQKAAVEEEGERLLRFLKPEATERRVELG